MNKNLEMMKKLIEEKKQKGSNTKHNGKATKTMGNVASKGPKVGNGGGLFDK